MCHLSRKSFPKQFVARIGNKKFLHLMLVRVFLLKKTLSASLQTTTVLWRLEPYEPPKVQGTDLVEPVARNTAVTMAIEASLVKPKA
jgi:mannose-1-phosphate guanylyltransferase/mannose-6-phosphate isomerase